eukprot:Awhi_evm1s11858
MQYNDATVNENEWDVSLKSLGSKQRSWFNVTAQKTALQSSTQTSSPIADNEQKVTLKTNGLVSVVYVSSLRNNWGSKNYEINYFPSPDYEQNYPWFKDAGVPYDVYDCAICDFDQ